MKLGEGGASEEEMTDYFGRLLSDCDERYRIDKKDIDHWIIVGEMTVRQNEEMRTTFYWSSILTLLILLILALGSKAWWVGGILFVVLIVTLVLWFRYEARSWGIRYRTEPALVKRYEVPFPDAVLRINQGLSFRRMRFVVFDVQAEHDGQDLRGTIFQVLGNEMLVTAWQRGGEAGRTTVHVYPSTADNADKVNDLRSMLDGHVSCP
jgi:Ca2+/Na+ antiporter